MSRAGRRRGRLDLELVERGLVDSRGEAVDAIGAGRVLVAGSFAEKASRMVGAGEPIELLGPPAQFVSRGGLKLDHALNRFEIDVEGRICLDAGASTGGFTDCLLQRGAAQVIAVDVGRGQLARRIADDRRVTIMDGTNARYLSPADLSEAPSLVVADLSFIGLAKVVPALVSVATPDASFVLLVKPQFEAGREQIGRGGIVRDRATRRTVLQMVAEDLRKIGLDPVGVTASPTKGKAGNVEFLGLWRSVAGVATGDRECQVDGLASHSSDDLDDLIETALDQADDTT